MSETNTEKPSIEYGSKEWESKVKSDHDKDVETNSEEITKILKKIGSTKRIGREEKESSLIRGLYYGDTWKTVYKRGNRKWTFLIAYCDRRFQIKVYKGVSNPDNPETYWKVFYLCEFPDFVNIEKLEDKLTSFINIL